MVYYQVMSHLVAKKQKDGKLKIFNKETGKTEGKPLPDTAQSKKEIKYRDEQQDKKEGKK